MADYLVAVFTDLVKSSEAWKKIPQDPMAGIIGEYTNIAEKTAAEFGQIGQNFTGDGHFFLFRNADAAVRFSLTLIDAWRQAFQDLPALTASAPIPLRVGAHFGVEAQISENIWVGRCGNTAKSIEGMAAPDTLLVSEGMLDLIDLPLYDFSRFGSCKLKSDHVDNRVLYRIDTFDSKVFLEKPDDDLTPEDWFLRASAIIGTDRENTKEEEQCYQKALELREEYPEAHVNYGALLQNQERYDEAEKHLARALELRENDPKAHFNLALLLTLQHRTKEAETHYKKSFELNEFDSGMHNNYGVLLAEDDRPAEAEAQFKEALRLRPDDPDTHYNYGVLLRDRPDDSEEHFKEALRLRPDYPAAHYNFAALMILKGRRAEAEEHYREALKLDPDDPEIKRAVEEEFWKETPPAGAKEA